VAEIVTVVELATAWVVAVKIAVVFPALTVVFAGTVAAAVLLLLSDTVMPPAGAGALKVTVPVAGVPPVTLDGLTLTEVRVAAAGVTVRPAVRVVVP